MHMVNSLLSANIQRKIKESPRSPGDKEARLLELLAFAFTESEQLNLAPPVNADAWDIADCLHRNGDLLFLPGDPNLDNTKRDIAVQVFLDFSAQDLIEFGNSWLEKWGENEYTPWHKEWREIIKRGEKSELKDILLSASQERVRQRSSSPFAGMLSFDKVLFIKRRWRKMP